MSTEAYAAEKDNHPLRIEKVTNGHPINYNRSDGQKILDKIRRIITAMDLELETLDDQKLSAHLLSEYAKQAVDELTVFI